MKWLISFIYAGDGIVYALRTQKHMRFHAVAASAVILASLYAGLEPGEWLWVLLAIALVWSAELINTAIESVVDLVSPERHPLAKAAKDTAAAAVLAVSVFAAVVAVVVLLPALYEQWRQ
jgi:undecaprenol kinase